MINDSEINENKLFFEKLQKIYKLQKEPMASLKGDSSPEEILSFQKKFWNKAVIYAWVNKQTLQCYIGSTKKAHKRLLDHLLRPKSSNIQLQSGFKKFGKENFVLIILEQVTITENEIIKIKDFNTILDKTENFYLRTIPRSLQYNIAWYAFRIFISDEDKLRISLRMRGSKNPMYGKTGPLAPGFHKKGSDHHMFGKKHTLEARQKISEKAKIRYADLQLYSLGYPVQLINVKTNKLTEPFKSLTKAGKFLGYKTSNIIRKSLKNPSLILLDEWRARALTKKEFLTLIEKKEKSFFFSKQEKK